MNEDLRRKELADFLKNRRERLSPLEVGLPGTVGRRRTSGLRREEVAALAGISLPWYTALEQGRDIKVSDSVLESLAHTLRLFREERVHLYMLANRKVPLESTPFVWNGPNPDPQMKLIIDQFGHLPAYAIDGHWNLLVWNKAAEELFGTFDSSKKEKRARNLIWMLFTNPVFQSRFADWEMSATKLIAAFRTAYARRMEDSCFAEIVGGIGDVSAEFMEIWERHDVQNLRDNRFQFAHPGIGEINLLSTTFYAAEQEDVTMVVYTPASSKDGESLMRLQNLYRQVQPKAVLV